MFALFRQTRTGVCSRHSRNATVCKEVGDPEMEKAMLLKRRLQISAALLTGVGCAVLAVPSLSGVARAADCETAVFETDGYGHGLDLSNFAAFNAAIPPGYVAHPIPYQDGIFPGIDKKDLDQATADGTALLNAAVLAFHASCPSSHMIIAGYSEGAIVAGDELNALSRSGTIPHGLIDGVLYGDPRRSFGDGGVGGVAGGIETNLPTILKGVTMRGPRGFGDIPVHEICDENDGICNSANMITNALAFANGLDGYLSGDHGYNINPVRDQGNGLTLNLQTPLIPYGPPLPLPIVTPWQLSQGNPAEAQTAVQTALGVVRRMIPAPAFQALSKMPWFRVLTGSS
jgi:hypothetical protein